MKLRIRGNSIRLRLGRSEVAMLERAGHVEDGIAFGLIPSETLRYRLQSTDRDHIFAEFQNGCIAINVPRETIERWVEGGEVSLAGSQPVEDGDELSILVEKDFECLRQGEMEGESDSFPHPKEKAAC